MQNQTQAVFTARPVGERVARETKFEYLILISNERCKRISKCGVELIESLLKTTMIIKK